MKLLNKKILMETKTTTIDKLLNKKINPESKQ